MPTTPISTIDCERYLVCHPREIEHILRGILAHELPGVAGDYNKAEHLQARVEWLTWLGDRLDELTAARAALVLVKTASQKP